MNYLSFFSGIGGFERALHKVIPKAKCIGFSEIDQSAIDVYKQHYPIHENLGDICNISKKDFSNLIRTKGCRMIVGGFPCTNLTSQARIRGNTSGIDGPQSGLLRPFLALIKIAFAENPNLDLIIENNASMKSSEKERITKMIQRATKRKVYVTELNAADFGLQQRRRLFWTTFPIKSYTPNTTSWTTCLIPFRQAKELALPKENVLTYLNSTNTNRSKSTTLKAVPSKHKGLWNLRPVPSTSVSRLEYGFIHDTNRLKSRPILRNMENIKVLDKRNKKGVLIRRLHVVEIERLFGFPDGYVGHISLSRALRLLGNSVHVEVIRHIVKSWKAVRSK